MNQNNKTSKRSSRKSRNRQPRVPTVPREASTSSALGTLVGGALNFAKSIPVLGSIVDTAQTVASSFLNLLGPTSNLYEVHYSSSGQSYLVPHRHVLAENGFHVGLANISPGSILMRYEISVGPTGSRSRRMGENFEKYQLRQFQLAVTSTCAATEPGQLAYVFVPDPLDRTLDTMEPSTRLEAILGRDTVQLAQIWQNTVLNFRIPPKQYFVQPEAGDERFASPGAVYVIAVTSLDSAKLPTLRQTSDLIFSRATSAPSSDAVQLGMTFLDVGTAVPADSLTFKNIALDAHSVSSIHNFDVNRVVTGKSYPGIAKNYTNSDVLKVYAGEFVSCSISVGIDNRTTSDAFCQFTTDFATFTELTLRLNPTQTGTQVGTHGTGMVSYVITAPSDGYVVFNQLEAYDVHPAIGVMITIYPSHGYGAPASAVTVSQGLTTHLHEGRYRCKVQQASDLDSRMILESAIRPPPSERKVACSSLSSLSPVILDSCRSQQTFRTESGQLPARR